MREQGAKEGVCAKVGRNNRRLHSEGLQDMIRVIWRRIRLVWGGGTCWVLVRKPEGVT